MFCVVGLDPSLRVPAAVELNAAGEVHAFAVWSPSVRDVEAFKYDGRGRVFRAAEVHVGDEAGSWERILDVAEGLARFCWSSPAEYVGIEDHAPGGAGAATRSASRLAHLQGIVRRDLTMGRAEAAIGVDHATGLTYRARAIPWVPLEPNVVKAFATGKGNALKPEMVAAAIAAGFWQLKRLGVPAAEGCADAYWIARLTQLWAMVRTNRIGVAELPPLAARLFAARADRPGLAARAPL